MKISKFVLEITVFVCGAVVMMFELLGSRVLGPFFGTSIFVWTSIIGIILGSLSAGYYFGGKLADKKADFKGLSLICFLTAVFIVLATVIKTPLILLVINFFENLKISLIIVSGILFIPASVLMGMVSPYAAKLKLDNLSTSGSTVGNLYALSTLGSIFGTFAAGFYLIPRFGTNKLLLVLAIILMILSFGVYTKQLIKIKVLFLAFVFGGMEISGWFSSFLEKRGFVDVDTPYNRVLIYDGTDKNTGEKTRFFSINIGNSSAMFLDKDDLVFEYSKYYHLAGYFKPDFKKTLMLGGAGYSYPKDFLRKYPEASIDVVEIDPGVTALAKKYFKLSDNPRLNIYHEDGRVFLNRTKEKYDVIFGDAFSSHHSLPYQLATKEAVQKAYDVLNSDGVVLVNIISAIEGDKGLFLRAEYATYKSVFDEVYLFPVTAPENGEQVQNIILVALKGIKYDQSKTVEGELNDYLGHLWKQEIKQDLPFLTDDYAPVDYYTEKNI